MQKLSTLVRKKSVAICAAAFLVSSPAAWAETLGDALISAYKSSGLLEQQRALLRVTDEGVAQAVSALRPVLQYAASANVSDTPFLGQTSSANLELSAAMTVYDFGRTQLAIDAAKESVLTARERLVGVEQSVLLRAVAAYMSVREASAIVNLRENNVNLITQELRAANDRFDVGEITQTDVSIAEARLAASRSALAAARGNLAVGREEYKAITGHYPGNLKTPPAAPISAKSLQNARSVARKTHPDVLAAQRDVTVTEINVARAKAAMKPTIGVNGRLGIDENGDNTSSVGLNMQGVIYQGGNLTSVVRSAIARRDAARAALLLSGQTVEQNVGNSWANLQVAIASLDASDRQIRASRVAYRGVSEEAKFGARTTLDVLNAEQELLDAQANRVSADAQRYVAVYQLLSSMGLLTAEHLKLGITTYDPAGYYNTVKSAPSTYVSPQGQKLDRVLKSLGKF